MYTALVLSPDSQEQLKNLFPIPDNWTSYCHHMTINMNEAIAGPAANLLNQPASLKLIAYANDEKVMAAKVLTDVPSTNTIKHVTIAVNHQLGGKPFHSNQLKNWIDLPISQQLILHGFVEECK